MMVVVENVLVKENDITVESINEFKSVYFNVDSNENEKKFSVYIFYKVCERFISHLKKKKMLINKKDNNGNKDKNVKKDKKKKYDENEVIYNNIDLKVIDLFVEFIEERKEKIKEISDVQLFLNLLKDYMYPRMTKILLNELAQAEIATNSAYWSSYVKYYLEYRYYCEANDMNIMMFDFENFKKWVIEKDVFHIIFMDSNKNGKAKSDDVVKEKILFIHDCFTSKKAVPQLDVAKKDADNNEFSLFDIAPVVSVNVFDDIDKKIDLEMLLKNLDKKIISESEKIGDEKYLSKEIVSLYKMYLKNEISNEELKYSYLRHELKYTENEINYTSALFDYVFGSLYIVDYDLLLNEFIIDNDFAYELLVNDFEIYDIDLVEEIIKIAFKTKARAIKSIQKLLIDNGYDKLSTNQLSELKKLASKLINEFTDYKADLINKNKVECTI